MTVFIVVDTETGRYYDAFTEYVFAHDAIVLSYSKLGPVTMVHEDVWNTDFVCPNKQRLTIKRVQPHECADHL